MDVLRTCILSRIKDKRINFFRIAYFKDNSLKLDLNYNLGGRGFYLKKDKEIINKAKKINILEKKLKSLVDLSFYDNLIELLC